MANVPTFTYEATSGRRFKAVTLESLLQAAGLPTKGARAIYGGTGTPHQGVPLVLLGVADGDAAPAPKASPKGEDEVLAVLNRLLRGRLTPVDAARAITEAPARKRGRPRKTG